MSKVKNQQQLVKLIKSCGESRDLEAAKRVYKHIAAKEQLKHDRFFANLLVEMYGKCNCINEARLVFANIREPNLFSWTIMLSATALNGDLAEAKRIFDGMPEKDPASWNSIFTAYTHDGSFDEAIRFFLLMPQWNVVSWTAMLVAHAQNGDILKSKTMFDSMPEKNLPSWNAIMTAYAQRGDLEQARGVFKEMPQRNQLSWNSILAASAKFEELSATTEIFERIPERNPITWNAMLRAFVEKNQTQNGGGDELRRVFSSFPRKNIVSWNLFLQGCCCGNDEILPSLVMDRMPATNCVSWTALFLAYARSGQTTEALAAYESMPEKDSIAQTEMIGALIENRMIDEARKIFDRIRIADRNTVIWNSMVSGYAQEGRLEEASKLFNRMPDRNPVAWTSLIQAHAQHSRNSEAALNLFQLMNLDGVPCDGVTFLGVLGACSHSGLVDQACEYFKSMKLFFGVTAALEHYSCMVDLLGRAGDLKDAEELIYAMPFQPHSEVWTSFLGCCRTQYEQEEDIPLAGMIAAASLRDLEPESATSYVSMYNLCLGA